MKKSLIVTLALVFVLGIAGTAFANPYSDVPAGHWAYKAVMDLTKVGVVEGHAGKYYGNQNMTRYEMAAITARAMAKADKADAATKATIDKLAVEFAAELNNLGVRVAKLEKNASAIKVEGESRLMYSYNDKYTNNAAIAGSNAFEWRQRLHLNADITPDVKYTARLEAKSNAGTAANTVAFNRNFFTISNKLGLDNIQVGRIGHYSGRYFAVGQTSNTDGIIANDTWGTVKANAFWTVKQTNVDYKGIVLTVPYAKKAEFDFGYLDTDSYAGGATAAYPASQALDFGVWFELSKGLNLVGEYVDTDADGVAVDGKAWVAQLSYNWVSKMPTKKFFSTVNVVDIKKAHDQGVVVSYRDVETNGLPGKGAYGQFGSPTANSFYDATRADRDNIKGVYVGYQNVMMKNILLNLEYADLKSKTGTTVDDKMYAAYVQFFF